MTETVATRASLKMFLRTSLVFQEAAGDLPLYLGRMWWVFVPFSSSSFWPLLLLNLTVNCWTCFSWSLGANWTLIYPLYSSTCSYDNWNAASVLPVPHFVLEKMDNSIPLECLSCRDNTLIHVLSRVIYPVDKAIHPLNNEGQVACFIALP